MDHLYFQSLAATSLEAFEFFLNALLVDYTTVDSFISCLPEGDLNIVALS